MQVSPQARKREPSLPERWQARLVLYPNPVGASQIKGVLCSLTDANQYPEQDLLDVYFERWEIENSYGETKHGC